MTALLNKYKKPLLFVLALVPIAIVGGYLRGSMAGMNLQTM